MENEPKFSESELWWVGDRSEKEECWLGVNGEVDVET